MLTCLAGRVFPNLFPIPKLSCHSLSTGLRLQAMTEIFLPSGLVTIPRGSLSLIFLTLKVKITNPFFQQHRKWALSNHFIFNNVAIIQNMKNVFPLKWMPPRWVSYKHDQRQWGDWIPKGMGGKKFSGLTDWRVWLRILRNGAGDGKDMKFKGPSEHRARLLGHEHLEAFLDGDSVSRVFVVRGEPSRMGWAGLLSHRVKFLQCVDPISLLVEIILEKHDHV